MDICGIYKITNLINNKFYIGKSKTVHARWGQHIRASQVSQEKWDANKRKEQTPLHKAIRKYGVDNFQFEIIEECSPSELNAREKYWIDFFNAFNSKQGYNCTKGGDGYCCGGGENSTSNILTQKEVDFIKQSLREGWTAKQIQKYVPKASYTTISNINNGRSWIDEKESYPISKNNGHRKWDNDTVLKIRELYQQGTSIKKLAILYDAAEPTISSLVKGKTYTEVPVLPRQENFHFKNKKRIWSNEEVKFYRQQYSQGQSIFSLYKEYEQARCCYATFYNMIKGITYKNLGE